LRPEVKIVTGIVSSQGASCVNESTMGEVVRKHPVYVVSRQPGYCPAFILGRYPLVEAGLLWRVAPSKNNRMGPSPSYEIEHQ
jgi:hypothetical protein